MSGSSKYKAVIFDFDGTLSDSGHMNIKAIEHAAKACDLTIPENTRIRDFISLGVKEVFCLLFPREKRKFELFDEAYYSYRADHIDDDATPPLYDGVLDVMRHLNANKVKIGVATGSSPDIINAILPLTGLTTFIPLEAVRAVSDEVAPKPEPQMLLELLEEFNVKPEDSLMVGDATYDIDMANNAKMDGLAIASGFSSKESLERVVPSPVGCLDSMLEFIDWFDKT